MLSIFHRDHKYIDRIRENGNKFRDILPLFHNELPNYAKQLKQIWRNLSNSSYINTNVSIIKQVITNNETLNEIRSKTPYTELVETVFNEIDTKLMKMPIFQSYGSSGIAMDDFYIWYASDAFMDYKMMEITQDTLQILLFDSETHSGTSTYNILIGIKAYVDELNTTYPGFSDGVKTESGDLTLGGLVDEIINKTVDLVHNKMSKFIKR